LWFFLFLFLFWGRVSWNICLGLTWTMILLISASWVARITHCFSYFSGRVLHFCPGQPGPGRFNLCFPHRWDGRICYRSQLYWLRRSH
jgi:hypothetical protein